MLSAQGFAAHARSLVLRLITAKPNNDSLTRNLLSKPKLQMHRLLSPVGPSGLCSCPAEATYAASGSAPVSAPVSASASAPAPASASASASRQVPARQVDNSRNASSAPPFAPSKSTALATLLPFCRCQAMSDAAHHGGDAPASGSGTPSPVNRAGLSGTDTETPLVMYGPGCL